MKKYLFIFTLILSVFIFTGLKAELIKPNSNIDPYKVVKIQLTSLMKNNYPDRDNGIKQTWEFAHPSNKKYTGPLSKFITLLKGQNYKMLINHLDNEIIEIFKTSNKYGFEVTILSNDKNYYRNK